MKEYACQAFHSSLDNGRSSGRLVVSARELDFIIAGQHIRCSSHDINVHMGGASNRLVFFTHPSYPEWNFYTSDRQILHDPSLKAIPSVESLLSKARAKRASGWALLAMVAAIIVAVPLFLLFRMDLVTGAIAPEVPVSWEQSLGESALAQYRIGAQFMEDVKAEEALAPLVSPLIEALPDSRYSYQFSIVNDSAVNAFALPGGKIVIHSSLILKAQSAEELLGVLAHEIMHVEQQHGIRNVMGAAGIYILISGMLGDVSGVLAVLSSAAPLLLNQSYSRRYEQQADSKGLELLVSAGIDPRGLVDFFAKLKSQEAEQLASIEDEQAKAVIEQAMAYLSTHPATDSRIAHLNELIAQYQNEFVSAELSQSFKALQSRVRAFVESVPADSTPSENKKNEK
ncbi:M48 family metallopeptidase [Agarilytica rhodophyticola]|uniref:M48 family metallopeptidase n=1 Tax=Agarilytica rhodophyticola TaxID=1737490 RepID=UPI000B345904|nr:M48 family metallopeptidase [Agarilytica rhodophyticola]